MPSTMMTRFLEGLNTNDPLNETYDLTLYSELNDIEREQAFLKLIQRATEQDPRALMSLAALNDPRCISLLRAISSAAGDGAKTARRALARMGNGNEVLNDLIQDTQSGSHLGRFAAITELGKIPEEKAIQGLLDGLRDANALVRMQALDGLIEQFQLEPYLCGPDTNIVELRSPLKRLGLLLTSDLLSLQAVAVAELEAIFNELKQGKSGEAIGLVFDGGTTNFRQNLGAALREEDASIPLNLFKSCTPHDRIYGETLMAIQMDRGNTRCPSGLAALGAQWTQSGMQEMLGLEIEEELRDEINNALRLFDASSS